MSVTNDLLLRNEWKDTGLHSAVSLAIAPFSTHNQIAVQGPEVMVSPVVVENIMMALHELLTNSAKYGALSSGDGKSRYGGRQKEQDCTLYGKLPDYKTLSQLPAKGLGL
jgi:two-component sensor histidine kinase